MWLSAQNWRHRCTLLRPWLCLLTPTPLAVDGGGRLRFKGTPPPRGRSGRHQPPRVEGTPGEGEGVSMNPKNRDQETVQIPPVNPATPRHWSPGLLMPRPHHATLDPQTPSQSPCQDPSPFPHLLTQFLQKWGVSLGEHGRGLGQGVGMIAGRPRRRDTPVQNLEQTYFPPKRRFEFSANDSVEGIGRPFIWEGLMVELGGGGLGPKSASLGLLGSPTP